jgi:erythromycin esterase-like protein
VGAQLAQLGDNRTTELGQAGQLNVGRLVRERYGQQALLVGFTTTYTGTVTAASQWGGPAERKNVCRSLPVSWEELFREQGVAAFLLDPSGLHGRRLERAIGVIYQPRTERISHDFHAVSPTSATPSSTSTRRPCCNRSSAPADGT